MVQILLAMNQKQQFKIKNDGDKKSIFLIEIFRYTAQNFLQIFYSKAFIFVRKRLYHLVDIWVFVNEGEKKKFGENWSCTLKCVRKDLKYVFFIC